VVALLILANLAVYAQTWNHDFTRFDDPVYVTENPYIANGLTGRAVWWAFTSLSGYAGNWHPITWLSHMVDVGLFGLSPRGHHLMSVAIHVVNTLLLFGLLYRTTTAFARSAFVAALFAVHPVHVESVAWIAERKDVLSTFFWLLTIWAYAVYVRSPRPRVYILMILLFALGLMTKPMLVTLPFTLLLFDLWPLGRARLERNQIPVWARLAREKLPLFALAFASGIVTVVAQSRGGAVQTLAGYPLGLRLENAVVSYAAYIGKLFWPVGLSAYYPYPTTIPGWQIAIAALILVGMTALAIASRTRHPCMAMGWFWFVVALLPVIGVAQVGAQSMADRYTYVPYIGLFIILAWAVGAIMERHAFPRIVSVGAGVLAVCVCALLARSQVRYWKNGLALWQRAVAINAGNPVAHQNLAFELWRARQLRASVAHYEEALRIAPEYAVAHANIGIVLAEQGKLDDAILHYREALRLNAPGVAYAAVHTNLGAALLKEGRSEEALSHYQEALRIDPNYAQAHLAMGNLFARQGKTAEAIAEYQETLRLQPLLTSARASMEALLRQK
jgi:tetratricopeptide (TPR) repeat protein